MINISAKLVYTLQALFELAKVHGRGPLQAKEIAKKEGIPYKFLEQLFISLKRGGLVKSIRGANGGYILAIPPSKISVYDLFMAVGGGGDFLSVKPKKRVLDKFFAEKEVEVKKLFSKSLQELVDEEKEIEKNIVYYI